MASEPLNKNLEDSVNTNKDNEDLEDNLKIDIDYVKNKWGKQKPLKKGLYNSTLKLSKNVLNEGIFSITVDIFLPPAESDSSFQVRKRDVLSFEIIDSFDTKGARGSYPGVWQVSSTTFGGYMIRPLSKFETKFERLTNNN